MSVDRHGDSRAGVTESLGDHLDLLPRRQQVGGVGVAQVVQPDRRLPRHVPGPPARLSVQRAALAH
jgi:hypothetical protein